MKKNISHILSFCVTLFYLSIASSQELQCPPAKEVKNVLLIKAFQHPYDPDCWNFASTEFTYKGVRWNVWFGTFLIGISNPQDALKEGQLRFNQSTIRIPSPMPYETAKKVTACNYVPEGDLYWLSAVSPPTSDQIP